MDIEWNPAKAKSNFLKHGIRFSDVEAAFSDPHALLTEDAGSSGEERFVLLGSDSVSRIVVVVYTYRESTVRIISARKANKPERSTYAEGIRF